MNKKLILGLGAGALIVGVGLAVGVFEVQSAFYDVTVDQPLPDAMKAATPVAVGTFHDVAHAASGTARIARASDGSHWLRFEQFRVDNGPTLRVVLVAADEARDDAAVETAGSIDVGELAGNVGNQSYQLPAEYDPAKHRAVSIWCDRFSVNFGAAPLRAPGAK